MHSKFAQQSRVPALVATAIAACLSMWVGVALLPGFGGTGGEPMVSPLWPAAGINVAMLWLCGLRVWPGLLVGVFIGNFLMFGDLRSVAAYTPGPVLEAVIVVAIMRRLTTEPALHLLTRRAALSLIAAGVLGPVTSITLTALLLRTLGFADPARGFDNRFWLTWFIADGLSAIVITPVVVSALEHRRIPWTRRPVLYGLSIALGLLASSAWLFHEIITLTWLRPEPLLFITLPFIAWAALSFGVLGASLATLGLAFLSITGTLYGRGPFADLGAIEGILLLQIYLAVAAVMSLLLGASTSARGDAFRASEASRAHVTKLLNELDHRVRNNMATLLGLAQLASISSSSYRPPAPSEPAPAAPGSRPPLDIFEDRVRAMARVHTLLSSSRWSAAKLSHIVAGIVAPEAPQSPDRLRLSGHDPALEPEACQPLSLTLHELAANARLHGAWSSSAAHGFVEIRATRTDDAEIISWIEHGATPAPTNLQLKDPPDELGFTGVGGLALARGFITHELGGQFDFRYRDSGIEVVITLPRDRPGLFAR